MVAVPEAKGKKQGPRGDVGFFVSWKSIFFGIAGVDGALMCMRLGFREEVTRKGS